MKVDRASCKVWVILKQHKSKLNSLDKWCDDGKHTDNKNIVEKNMI